MSIASRSILHSRHAQSIIQTLHGATRCSGYPLRRIRTKTYLVSLYLLTFRRPLRENLCEHISTFNTITTHTTTYLPIGKCCLYAGKLLVKFVGAGVRTTVGLFSGDISRTPGRWGVVSDLLSGLLPTPVPKAILSVVSSSDDLDWPLHCAI